MRIEHRLLGEVGRGGGGRRLVDGGDERSRSWSGSIQSSGRRRDCCESQDDLPGAIWRVVLWPRASSQIEVVGDAGVVGRREYEGLLGED